MGAVGGLIEQFTCFRVFNDSYVILQLQVTTLAGAVSLVILSYAGMPVASNVYAKLRRCLLRLSAALKILISLHSVTFLTLKMHLRIKFFFCY